MPFARGTPKGFIAANAAGVAAISSGAAILSPSPATAVLWAVAALGCVWIGLLIWFFRDPGRAPGKGVVSPADGRVREAASTGQGAHMSVFLGVFNVHVVRAPIAGRVATLAYRPGGRRFAFSKDSHLNERLLLSIFGEGEACSLILIAGAFADRIMPYVEAGAEVAKGDRIGLIKFGSRVDLIFTSQQSHTLAVKEGSTVIAAVTSILLPAPEAGQP